MLDGHLWTSAERFWRPDPESNRGARICNPLRHHSAIGPERGRELLRFAAKVNPKLLAAYMTLYFVQIRPIVAQKSQSA
jgi:hypothetical protein